MVINSSFNYGNNILMSNINNFVHVNIKTLKHGYYSLQKSINSQMN